MTSPTSILSAAACAVLGALGGGPAGPAFAAPPDFAPGDTVLFYGGGMVERVLEHGELEARVQLAHPEKKLRFRSLAWTGDEVGWRLRPEGYAEHLRALLAAWPAQVVVLGYGANESFAGAAGLADFKTQLDLHVRELERRHPGARLVLLGPVAAEGDEARQRDLLAFGRAIADVAGAHGARWVDLHAATFGAREARGVPLITQGLQLTEAGCAVVARVVARALAGEASDTVDPGRLREVARAAGEKARRVADVVRPKNGVVYYGVRKRPEEYAVEMPRYHALIEQAEAVVHALAAEPGRRFADFRVPSLPSLPTGKAVPAKGGGGVIRAPAEQMAEFKVADGYAVNCFASEEQFPDLRNPVQMAFDARGRLWVATMPSFPHTVPGAVAEDKVLILEDGDRDGRADRCTTFASGFDALDGIAFHERGVIVSAQPRLLLLSDRDGDDRADSQVELLRGIDVTDSHHGGMVATDPLGHVLFADGVFHRSQFETPFGVVRGIDSTTYRLDPATGRVEHEWQTLTPNPWKIAFDRAGNLFQHFGGGHVLEALPLTWTPLGVRHPYGHGMVLNYNKGCALEVISSPNFPADLQQGIAQGTLLGSYFVSLSRVEATAGPLLASSRLDVLASPNAAFRPVDLAFGSDGALYVADFCSRIIGHAQHPMRDPQWDHEHGRIWRVVHTQRPLARDWPEIERAAPERLVALLAHPQNLVRHHVRIRLRGLGREVLPQIDAWAAGLDRGAPDFGSCALEALWLQAAAGQPQPRLLAEVAKARDPLVRAAAVQTLRFHPELPSALELLAAAAEDPHPRVQMAAIATVARVRGTHPGLEAAIAHVAHGGQAAPAVQQMLEDLKAGAKPMAGRSVPVLEREPGVRLEHWRFEGERGNGEAAVDATAADRTRAGKAAPRARTYRTWVEAEGSQMALLGVKHGYLDLSVNGVQLLSADSPFSSEQQVQFELRRGLNAIEISFRRLKGEPPPVFLSDLLGERLRGVHRPGDPRALEGFAARWAGEHPEERGALRVQAVPNQMLFAPRELRARAGQPVRLVFENPDLMLHNLVIVAAGAAEEVGALADAMAAQPDAAERHYLPASPKVLHATPLVKPGERAELRFTAPAEPGRYPFLCTFPGHWRIMRGELLVE